ncbi:uncharacterized protein MELLADRAFT_87824 [Melampsora larici-populina 98AG31]|uniref:E3 ubiquitin-protein ligase PEP5 n=1 Tax=Melampsora larici-populina (strain 98AG31 / pathotype 3-4-7) TaxID=747676 RepID=F4RPL5_MELLP|nr:uncharacterized protein MELLADRAFT_87824 [Melampsora larici-populina 98AG31]EGG05555.1 hypothetical protein MELLADRAFT_87824 [Melampsora larici-populina 98AG31]
MIKPSHQNTQTQWRHLNFFDSDPIQFTSKDLHPFKDPNQSNTFSSGHDSIAIGQKDGQIHCLDRNLNLTRSWLAFQSGQVSLLKFTKIKGLLISIGDELGSSFPILKIWNLRFEDKHHSSPQLLAHSKIQIGPRPHPVTTIALTDSLTYLSLGLADGTVILYRHLDQALVSNASIPHQSTNRITPLLPKPKVVYSSPEPITGLGFNPSKPNSNISLFIVTTAKVLTYVTSGKGAGNAPLLIDDLGAGIGCIEVYQDGSLVLANDSALYLYGSEGRQACLAYDGPKNRIDGVDHYLMISGPTQIGSTLAHSNESRLIVFDLENRLVAHSTIFKSPIHHVWSYQSGEIFVLSGTGEVTRLIERSLNEKLEMMFEKELYMLAVNVAKIGGASESELAEIYKRYGDSCYLKSDYQLSVQQYIKTIGIVQPSFVIRKFLDAQRISNLTSYLQELHSQGVANSDHTTLLLNCYTKLKDHEKLNEFIKLSTIRNSGKGKDQEELPFELETAIRVCRQAGYFDHALYLAQQFDQNEDYLRIQIEDRYEWKDALEFIRNLGPIGAEVNLLRYGKPLLANLTKETTELMIDVCCGTMKAKKTTRNQEEEGEEKRQGFSKEDHGAEKNSLPSLRQFFAFFIDQPDSFIHFLETVAFRRWGDRLEDEEEEEGEEEEEEDVWVNVREEEEEKKVEIESEREDKEAVWGTLLELYLQTSTYPKEEKKMRSKALRLLRSKSIGIYCEASQALIVCLAHDFLRGIVLLYERLGMDEEVLRVWIDLDLVKDSEKQEGMARVEIVGLIHKYIENKGGKRRSKEEIKNLVSIGLKYLLSCKSLQEKDEELIEGVLEQISEKKVLEVIEVVELFGSSEDEEHEDGENGCSLGRVKKYLLKEVMNEKMEIEADRILIESYRKENSKKLEWIKEITNVEKPKVLKTNDRCKICDLVLVGSDQSVLHFMCSHSFHQRCLGEEIECQICKPSNELIKEIQRRRKFDLENCSNKQAYDGFLDELSVVDDSFGYIAGFFSKGLL